MNFIHGVIMAKKDKNALPPTGAGLVRYFDEESTGPKLSPEQIVIITIILAAFCFILRFS
ncbi:preprotein translocase subunit SecG [Methanobrevibacter curvatus]|uniref:Preprotein translocase subunit SecG n=2 Tax=Methanobrevibacter curvatus TaxID=49547 RepID=A0A166CLN7_9EURY|nr:preprotein translocase subunit SecG [Methanobrevibacter curvatus]